MIYITSPEVQPKSVHTTKSDSEETAIAIPTLTSDSQILKAHLTKSHIPLFLTTTVLFAKEGFLLTR